MCNEEPSMTTTCQKLFPGTFFHNSTINKLTYTVDV